MRPAAINRHSLEPRSAAVELGQMQSLAGWASHAPPRYWRGAVAATLILFAVIPMRVAELYPPLAHIKPAILVGLGCFGALWLRSGARARRSMLRDEQFRYALLFYCVAVASAVFALYRRGAFEALQGLLIALLPMASFLLVAPRLTEYEKLRRGMFCIAVLYSLVVASRGRVVEGSRLTTGGMFDPNDLCAVLVPMVALALASVVRGKIWERILGAASVGVLTFVIGQTASRGGFVGLIVTLIVFAAALDSKRTVIAVLAIVIGGVGLWQFGPDKFRERIGGLGEVHDDYNMTREEGRIQIWKRGLGYVAERPVLGVGINNMKEAEGRRLERLGLHGKWWPAHNAFLQALVETGLVGGIVFLVMIGIAVKRAARLWRPKLGPNGAPGLARPEVLAAILGYYSAIAFLSHAYSYMLYALLGFATFAWRCSNPAYNAQLGASGGAA